MRPLVLCVFFLVTLACQGPDDETGVAVPDPFADALVSFEPGPNAGFGEEYLPHVVLGAPHSLGAGAGSLDVVSLGERGEIVLEFLDLVVVDGPGIDLLVFENPFPGWVETGEVSISNDGLTWHTFPCAQDGSGCAGLEPVLVDGSNFPDPVDVAATGGDGFDLAELGVESARFVRVIDSGDNSYSGTTGGFDLDGIAVVNGAIPVD